MQDPVKDEILRSHHPCHIIGKLVVSVVDTGYSAMSGATLCWI